MNNFKPIRIGIDARLWKETGVGRYIRNLVIELQKIDKENEYVLFVRLKDAEEVRLSLVNNNWSLVVADIQWHTVAEQLEFPKILKNERLDLVHFPYFSVPIWYKGKYVITIHDLILHHFPTGKASTRPSLIYWLKHVSYKYIISRAARKAVKIITVSNATKDEVIKHLYVPEEKVDVTYEGVDAGIKNLELRIKDLPEKYFLYVGNAYPHKNLERLVKGFAQVLQRSKTPLNIKLIFIGKEDYFYNRLEERVKGMGLEESIIFQHNISDSELAEYYSHAMALVAPSYMEGFGLPLLEAMEHECLVVASDIPVFKEIAEDIPLYFSPTDVNQLADVLESIAKGRIQNAKERKEKGKLQAKKFSWEEMARKTQKTYQSCLGI